MEQIRIRTRSAQCLEDVTEQVADAVRQSGVVEGVCHLFVPHTTAGLVINENADPDVGRDLLEKLEALVPSDASYHHLEGNARSLMCPNRDLVLQFAAVVQYPESFSRLSLDFPFSEFFLTTVAQIPELFDRLYAESKDTPGLPFFLRLRSTLIRRSLVVKQY